MNDLEINCKISNIINKRLINYINNEIDTVNINEFLNKILELGFFIYNHLDSNPLLYNNKKNTDNTQHNHLLNHVNDLLVDHENKIINVLNEVKINTNQISNLFNKSSIKGVCGENIINEIFYNYFPNYVLKNVCDEPHSGDFHLFIPDINETILLETKFYNHTVDQKEVNKLYYDMNYTGIKYSMLISLSSNIVNKKNNIEWEINNDNIIIFLSNTINNSNDIIIGIMILKTLISLLKSKKDNDNIKFQNFTLNTYKKIIKSVNEIFTLKTSINKIKNNISNIHTNMSNQILELYNSITILDNEFTQKLNLLQYCITNEFNSINKSIDIIDLQQIHNNINELKNHNIKKILQMIISDCYSNNMTIDNNWNIYKNNKKIGEIIILKTTINIHLINNLQIKNIKIENWNNILKILN